MDIALPQDCSHCLLMVWLKRPYPRIIPWGGFPKTVQLWDRSVIR